jgi:hypothetical protein
MSETNRTLASYQAGFASYLLAANTQSAPAPETWLAGDDSRLPGHVARTALALRVYRNNVIHSLTQALTAQFPVVCRLVGPDFFGALARDYVRSEPPLEPALTYYGHRMPEFIAASAACRQLPYLADVAALELHCQRALHARDDLELDLAALAAIEPSTLEQARLELSASATLLESSYPIGRIWAENLKESPDVIHLEPDRQHFILVYRRAYQVQVISLSPDAFILLRALHRGDSLLAAWTEVLQQAAPPAEDELIPLLGYLFGLDVFSDILLPAAEESL